MRKDFLAIIGMGGLLAACQSGPTVGEWVSTTYSNPWQIQPTEELATTTSDKTIDIDVTNTAQTIDGFGTCFNELGWTSLSLLEKETREGILKEMFAPGVGANFTICRMPVASNDFSLDYYSYDDTEGDFGMKNFSIEHDRATLIPFIKGALAYNPDLKIWASPWCPPTWMKWNKHYASRSTTALAKLMASRKIERQAGEETFMFRVVDNGLSEDRQAFEGADAFIQEDAYFKAYALYFSKFIDAYRNEGIDIFGVMPQNEFNSDQPYPSCCWTLGGLATFMGKYLGPAMEEKGVEMMYGTVERAREAMVDSIMQDPDCSRYVKTIGFQWAGKDILPYAAQKYPQLKFMQTEQECGDGKNDWRGASHAWDLMLHYFNNGVSIYTYWNTSLLKGGISRWGWAQNSLVTVNELDRTFTYTPEYYVLKHASHYVLPGAKRIVLGGTYTDALCFQNTDRSVVVLLANKTDKEVDVTINLYGKSFTPTLPANSVNTLLLNVH